MELEKYDEALNEISDEHIAESAKKRIVWRRSWWVAAVAAVLAVAIGIGIFRLPMPITAEALAIAQESRIAKRPLRDDFENVNDWRIAYDAWSEQNANRQSVADRAVLNMQSFLVQGNSAFLSTGTDNLIWSPINAYIALAMTAELTGGNTQQQLMDLLGTENTKNLRNEISALWEVCYSDSNNEICTLANSLWLENGLDCSQETLDVLSRDYYASVYRGDLGSNTMNSAIGAWLSNYTGGILRQSSQNIRLPQDTLLALYSTIYFQAKWRDAFSALNNTKDRFHAPSGDKTVIYMNKSLAQMDYYWGECFSAVALPLKNGSTMWLILPDEGMTTADVLQDGQYLQMICDPQWENVKYMKVNLSVPKFDIVSRQDLRSGLQTMGIADLFTEGVADFSALTAQTPLFVNSINQAVRVQIDEEGVKAAVYVEIPGAGSAAPPTEIIDFILDRPFLFAITRNDVPLFAGVVNEP